MRSIVGRFLEHSRIFHFAAGADHPVQGEFFIGSADWMYRNLSKRVEVVTPVVDPADGATEGPEAHGTHEVLMDLARRRCE